jgi:hypothetical protein
MESSGSQRSGLLTAGGVLSIISGVLQVIGAGVATGLVVAAFIGSRLRPFEGMPLPWEWSERVIFVGPFWIGIAALGLILGIVAIAGGVAALRRSSFGLSLAGAICALLPSGVLGILAIIFVSVSKQEFESQK